MKTILVINTGSSSVKYKLFDMPRETVLASGLVESIGAANGSAVCRRRGPDGKPVPEKLSCKDHGDAISYIFRVLSGPVDGATAGPPEIDAVGHRVVHGGERFRTPVRIESGVLEYLEGISPLAPLHLPLNIAGIRACINRMPHISQVACFDTAFFHSMPDATRLYPLPYEWYENYGIRRYGFHGISCEYLVAEAASLMGRPADDLKIIACHLGNGCSITAFDRGAVRDTSMGFTPLEGLMMGTRSGSFDPAIVFHMMARAEMSPDEVMDALNRKSGLAGISGIGNDMREIVAAKKGGSKRAALAFDMYVRILKNYIGAYCFAMNGADAIVFAGGIGENAPEVREAALDGLSFAGIAADPEKNRKTTGGRAGMIQKSDAPVGILVIPANEELMIARSVFAHS